MRLGPLPLLLPVLALACGGEARPAEGPKASAPESRPAASTADKAPESPPMESDDLRVLLPRDQTAEYFRMRGESEARKASFVPTRAEIEKLESGLPEMLREALRGEPVITPPLWERVKGYRRQYLPFVDASGTRWIWGNFMCQNPGRVGSDAWRKKIVSVDDGGDCFFSVEFSPDTGKYRRFSINGDG
jgi:hypothetical protein